MTFSSILLSVGLLFTSVGTVGEPVPAVEAPTVTLACTLSAEFESGGVSTSVTVTAPDCGSAARTLTAIADALDAE